MNQATAMAVADQNISSNLVSMKNTVTSKA